MKRKGLTTSETEQGASAIILYRADDGQTSLEVHLDHGTVWLSQAQMGELFGRDRSVITKHILNIFREAELEEKSNVQYMHFTHSDKPTTLGGQCPSCDDAPKCRESAGGKGNRRQGHHQSY